MEYFFAAAAAAAAAAAEEAEATAAAAAAAAEKKELRRAGVSYTIDFHLRSWFLTTVLRNTSPIAVSWALNPPAVPALTTRSGFNVWCDGRARGVGRGGGGVKEQ